MAVDELRAANPRAEIVVSRDQPVSGTWDADRLAQVVSNLIGNGSCTARDASMSAS